MMNKYIQKSMAFLLTAGLCVQPMALVKADNTVEEQASEIFRCAPEEVFFAYDGNEHKCGAEVEDMYGNILKENADYTIIYPEDITSVGTHKAIVRYMGKYAKNKDDQLKYNIEPGATKIKKEKTGNNYAGISWKKVKGAEYYQVLIRLKDGNKKIKVKTTSKNKMTVKGLEAGTKYVAWVTAYGKDKLSGKRTLGNYGSQVSFKTKGKKVYTTPELKAKFASGNKMKLTWKTGNNTDLVKLYRREKKTASAGGKFKIVGTFKTNVTSYKDQLKSGKFYDYKLLCCKKTKSSYKTVGKAGKLSAAGGFQAPDLNLDVNYQGEGSPYFYVQMEGFGKTNAKQPTHFEIYKRNDKSTWKKLKTVKLNKDNRVGSCAYYCYTDKAIKGGVQYSYKVRGVYQKQGKKEYSEFSNTDRHFGLDSTDSSNVRAELISPMQTAADEVTIKITNQNKDRKFYMPLYSEDEAYSADYFYGHYHKSCTLAACSLDGSNYMTAEQMKKQKSVKLGNGESIYLRFKTESQDTIGTNPSLYKECYMIFTMSGLEKTFASDVKIDLKKNAVCSYVEEG